MDIPVVFSVVLIGGAIYFLPFLVALDRGHNNTLGIFLINLFFGWTLLGWVIALVWAVTRPAAVPMVAMPFMPPAPAPQSAVHALLARPGGKPWPYRRLPDGSVESQVEGMNLSFPSLAALAAHLDAVAAVRPPTPRSQSLTPTVHADGRVTVRDGDIDQPFPTVADAQRWIATQ